MPNCKIRINRFGSWLWLASVLSAVFMYCADINNPYTDPKNAAVNVILESSGSQINENTLIDTVGKTFRVGIITLLPKFIDSINISIFCDTFKNAEKDTIIKPATTDVSNDTLWCSYRFDSAGPRKIMAEAFIQQKTTYKDSAFITIILRPETATNRAPKWGLDTISLPGAAGSEIRVYLSDKCFDPDNDPISFYLLPDAPAADSIINNSYVFMPLPSDTGVFLQRIVAGDNLGLLDTMVFKITLTSRDLIKPKMVLLTPVDSSKISSNVCQIKIKCTDASGILSVKCLKGTDSVDVSIQDSICLATVQGLKAGIVNTITFFAIDASPAANRDSLAVHIIYDSTMADNTPPIFTYVTGPKNNTRLINPTDTFVYSIFDQSGVDSVYWTLNGVKAGYPTKQPNTTNYKLGFTLAKFGSNRIAIHARDMSQSKNRDSTTITLNYSTKPGALTLTGPADKATGVDTLPTFTWTGGDDADGDTVYCKVIYGPTEAGLTLSTGEVKLKSVKLSSANKLTKLTKYYWQVIGWTKTYPDTVKSALCSFTTLDPVGPDVTGPAIAVQSGPINNSRVWAATGTITLSVTDPSGVDSVFAALNGGAKTPISGTTADGYSYTYTLTAFNLNKIVFYAKDKSSNHNRDSLSLALTYNAKPGPITQTGPADKATGVDTLPTFTWTGGDDADGDTVYYKVVYGTTEAGLTLSTSEVTAKNITLVAANKLPKVAKFYWQIIGLSKTYADTVKSAVFSFTTLDPTAADISGPSIAVQSGPAVNGRVVTATGTFTLSVTDPNGVDSVFAALNGGAKTPITAAAANIYSYSYSLTVYNQNRVVFYAKDKSANRNWDSLSRTFMYNTKPAAVTPTGPADNAIAVDTLPTFIWTGGDDADGDTLFCRVVYGTTPGNLALSTSEVKTKTASLTSANKLARFTKYYWQVIGMTRICPDTIASAVFSFTTMDPTGADVVGPAIALQAGPINHARVTAATGQVTVAVTDQSGVDSVFVSLNNGAKTPLTATSGASYSYNYSFAQYGRNVLAFSAVDKSVNRNRSSFIDTVNYNTIPAQPTAVSPTDNAFEIAYLPAFQWSGGADADLDSVFYFLRYGTASSALTAATSPTSLKTFTLTSALSSNTKYYWQVVAFSKVFPDTTLSSVLGFTTINQPPTSASADLPFNGATGISTTTGSFSFSAIDPENGPLRYTVVLGTDSATLLTSGTRSGLLSTTSYGMASVSPQPQQGRKYYWAIIASDNPTTSTNSKRDTSQIQNFYTENSAPAWTISGTFQNYRNQTISIYLRNLVSINSNPGHAVSFSLASGTGAAIIRNDSLIWKRSCSNISDTTINVIASDTWSYGPRSTTQGIVIGYRTQPTGTENMMFIPAAGKTFTMRSTAETELPLHSVTLTRDFWMDNSEVTQRDFDNLMSSFYGGNYATINSNMTWGAGDNYPIYCLSYYQAVLYCNARSRSMGLDTVYSWDRMEYDGYFYVNMVNTRADLSKNGYRLPTEAEFEFAYHAGTTGDYYYDVSRVGDYTWYSGNNNGYAHPVKSKLPNDFGLYDMSGNVDEWICDAIYTYGSSAQTDPFQMNPSADIADTGMAGYRLRKGGCIFSDITGTNGLRVWSSQRWVYFGSNTLEGLRCVRRFQ